MPPTHPVPCPQCSKPMYWAVSLEDAVDAGAADPAVTRSMATRRAQWGQCMK